MRQLLGHTSPETAYVVEDYPYGFRLRCKIRYWIETKPGFGQRFVSQTTNPKKAGEVWNKPKASTYHPVLVMGLNNDDHVVNVGLSPYAGGPEIRDFMQRFTLDDDQRGWMEAMLGVQQKMAAYDARIG